MQGRSHFWQVPGDSNKSFIFSVLRNYHLSRVMQQTDQILGTTPSVLVFMSLFTSAKHFFTGLQMPRRRSSYCHNCLAEIVIPSFHGLNGDIARRLIAWNRGIQVMV